MKAADPIDTARVELLLAELRLPAVKHVWAALPLPAGLTYGRDGRIGFNPDEEVQARLLHLFIKFRELRSAKSVMRHFHEANFLVPVRPLDGPSPHDVVWRPASNARGPRAAKSGSEASGRPVPSADTRSGAR